MNVLVIGSGGREHALVRKLAQSPRVSEVFVIKGNDAMAREATLVDIAEDDHVQIMQFAQDKNVSLVVVGPEQPLIDGLSDTLKKRVSKYSDRTAKQRRWKALKTSRKL